MIKNYLLGMYDIAKINAVLTDENDVPNYSFIKKDGVTYLVLQDGSGDDAHKEGLVVKAGEKINGYDISAWENQEIVIDEKHISYGSGEDYDDITAGTTLLTIKADGTLEIADSAPSTAGEIYFKVTAKTTLTEKAVKAKVLVAAGS